MAKLYQTCFVLDGKPIGYSWSYRVMCRLCGKDFARKLTFDRYIGEVLIGE